MRGLRTHGMIITVHGTSIKKGIILLILGLMMTFMITGVMTSLKPEYRISSSSINGITKQLSGESLIYLLGFENHYFTQNVPNQIIKPNFTSVLFQSATNINPDDPRSLLGKELPGFTFFDGEILVPGEGTNYTNMPVESAPPLEVLLAEREVATQNLEQLDKPSNENPVVPPTMTHGDKKVAYIYNTHSYESFFPHLKGVDTNNVNNATHSKVNITKVSEMLGEELNALGIGSDVNTTNMPEYLKEKGYAWSQSYKASGELVKSAMSSNKELEYFIDIHRDAKRRNDTTVTINGQNYAKIAFVIGNDNAQFDKNLKTATDLHNLLDKKYPGLSRGIIRQGGYGFNGKYNQDLSTNAMLVEFGGVDNNFDELRRTSKAMADVLAEYYWQAEKVNGSTEVDKSKQ